MISRLQNSIDQVYSIFSKYGGNQNMEGSPVYGEIAQWNKELFSKPIEELTEDELSRFTAKAMTTWGEVEDFKHFLPRILDLTAIYQTPYEIWIAFDKLNYANWLKWDQAEQDVVSEYMIALFDNLLNDDSQVAQSNFIDYFTTINHFYKGSNSIISLWKNSKTKASILHLSAFIVNQHYSIIGRNELEGFNNSNENIEQIKDWIFNRLTVDMLEKSFFDVQKEEYSALISEAESIIRIELNSRTTSSDLEA